MSDKATPDGRSGDGKFLAGNRLAKGGARPGAGRKPEVVRDAEQKLLQKYGSATNLDRYFAKLDELANDADPDVALAAVKVLLDRLLGRPRQPLELGGTDGNEMIFRVLDMTSK